MAAHSAWHVALTEVCDRLPSFRQLLCQTLPGAAALFVQSDQPIRLFVGCLRIRISPFAEEAEQLLFVLAARVQRFRVGMDHAAALIVVHLSQHELDEAAPESGVLGQLTVGAALVICVAQPLQLDAWLAVAV